MALAALVLLAVLAVVVVVLAVRQVRLGVQHKRMRLRVDALDARVGGVQRRLEKVPGIGTGRSASGGLGQNSRGSASSTPRIAS